MVKHIAPDWADKIHFRHHSNPASKHFSKTVFDKCYVRPKQDYCWSILKNEIKDPNISKEKARIILDKYKWDSAPMALGRTVQKICDARLLSPDELEKTYKTSQGIDIEKEARQELINYQPFEYAKEDKLKKEACLDALDNTVENAIAGIQEAMKKLGINLLQGETTIFMEDINGIDLPYNFKPDFSNLIELKVKAPTVSSYIKKDGTRTIGKGVLPKAMTPGWLNQVSVYHAYTNRMPALVVANEEDYRIFDDTVNDFALTKQMLTMTWENIVSDIKLHEHVLKQAYQTSLDNNYNEEQTILAVLRSVVPDFNDWSWKGIDPRYIEEAKQMWGYNAH